MNEIVTNIKILLFIVSAGCQDTNVLCKMEPAFLLDILCQIKTVSEQCPNRCNSCPEIGKYHTYLERSSTCIYNRQMQKPISLKNLYLISEATTTSTTTTTTTTTTPSETVGNRKERSLVTSTLL